MTLCSEIMTGNPKVLDVSVTVDCVAKTMRDNNVGPIPIVDKLETMQLMGIITDRDLAVKVIAMDKPPHETQVWEVMSHNLVTCSPEDKIEHAVYLMEKNQLRRIPVVDRNNQLVGIIAQADIANRLQDSEQTAKVVEEISKG